MDRRPLLPLTLLATVPYLLLSGAYQVVYHTDVYPNGSGYRFMTVDVSPDRSADIGKHAREAQTLCDFSTEEKMPGYVRLVRNYWAPDLQRLPDAQLKVGTLLAEPLSLFTKYEWTETIKFYADNATDVEKAGAAQATLIYTLEMPGIVAQESLSPAGQAEGGKVTFKLTADKPEYSVRATSYQLRYGTLAVLLYVLACSAIFGSRFLRHVISSRPRRI
jgi:hypothetical protein